jgi:hypothetical protein
MRGPYILKERQERGETEEKQREKEREKQVFLNNNEKSLHCWRNSIFF